MLVHFLLCYCNNILEFGYFINKIYLAYFSFRGWKSKVCQLHLFVTFGITLELGRWHHGGRIHTHIREMHICIYIHITHTYEGERSGYRYRWYRYIWGSRRGVKSSVTSYRQLWATWCGCWEPNFVLCKSKPLSHLSSHPRPHLLKKDLLHVFGYGVHVHSNVSGCMSSGKHACVYVGSRGWYLVSFLNIF